MEHWKRTIERANRCFMLGELVDAREAYLQALALAQVRALGGCRRSGGGLRDFPP